MSFCLRVLYRIHFSDSTAVFGETKNSDKKWQVCVFLKTLKTYEISNPIWLFYFMQITWLLYTGLRRTSKRLFFLMSSVDYMLIRYCNRVHCSFYFKIGACRHGEKCARKHVKPNFSQTLLMPNLYANPSHQQPDTCTMTSNEIQADFDLFYEDMYLELAKYGEIEELNICDNIGDHLVGNVYCRYKYEEDAGKAVESLNNRFYSGNCYAFNFDPLSNV